MTNQEAIEWIKKIYLEANQSDRCIALKMSMHALEKQMPKIPDVYGDGYDDKGNMIYDMYACPNCGENYEIDYDHYEYCPKCGQHMDKTDKVFE